MQLKTLFLLLALLIIIPRVFIIFIRILSTYMLPLALLVVFRADFAVVAPRAARCLWRRPGMQTGAWSQIGG